MCHNSIQLDCCQVGKDITTSHSRRKPNKLQGTELKKKLQDFGFNKSILRKVQV